MLEGSEMRKRVLSVLVVLLLIGAYAAYALSQPKLSKVKGCVNPFKVVKPVEKTPENWSSVHVFAKALASKDIRGLTKPWEVDYKNVKIAKHELEYNGEKIEMLAMGIPLKDGKHVIAYYKFSKPVQGVKVRAYLLEFIISEDNKRITTKAVTTNGEVTPLSSCEHECSSDADCNFLCMSYCCSRDYNIPCTIACCGACVWTGNLAYFLGCVLTECPWCYEACNRCIEYGTYCMDTAP